MEETLDLEVNMNKRYLDVQIMRIITPPSPIKMPSSGIQGPINRARLDSIVSFSAVLLLRNLRLFNL